MTPFDPSAKAKKDYMQSGMKPADYNNQRLEWLKRMAASEGKEYKPGYVPQGYTKIQSSPLNTLRERGKPANFTETWRYSSVNGKKPDALFWKPDAYAKHRPDLPAAKWDYTKDIQNYWHNPNNVINWHEHFRVQDEGYEPPAWLNKDFVEEQYKALKAYNDYEDDPLYWKPLPIGHEAAYYSNFGTDPQGNTPIYQQIAEQLSQPEAVTARYREYVEAAQTAQAEQQAAVDKELNDLINSAKTSTDAQNVIAKLDGKVEPEYVEAIKTYYEEGGLLPRADGSFAPTRPTPGGEGGSYTDLYPWQQAYQTFASTADTPGRPESSKNIADAAAALMPAIGVYGITTQILSAGAAINALATTGSVAAASTGVGIPAAVVIKIVGGLLAAGTMAYLYSQKDNPNNNAVQQVFGFINKFTTEPLERTIGAVGVANTLQQEGKPVDMRAAYDAGWLQNEMHANTSPLGNFLLDSISVAAEGIDVLGKAFGADWDLSSGKTTKDNEVWLFDEGFKDPQEAEIPLGKEGMLISYDQMKALGDNRTRDEMMIEWAYLTSLTGAGGTLNDYNMQNLLDLSNFMPFLENAGLEKYANAKAKAFIKEGNAYGATAFTALADSAKSAKGNLAIDALPMGVQQVGQWVAQKFETVGAYIADVNARGKISLKDFAKEYNPTIHGSMSVADSLNIYNARLEMGYNMPYSREFVIKPQGKVQDSVRVLPFTDGSLKMLNLDGSKSWDYTKENLDRIGVTFSNDESGNLVISGVRKLMADAKIPGKFVYDEVNTRINITPSTDSIDPTGAEYLSAADPMTFTVKKDNNTYTVETATGKVKSVVDADGKAVVLDKPAVWGENPVIIGGEIYSPIEANMIHDTITLADQSYVRASNPDYRSNADIKADGIRGKASNLNSGIVNKAIDWYTSLSELTPGNKALLEAENLREGILLLHMFSGNNFEMTMRAIKKMVGGADVRDVAKAADQFISQSGTVASVTGAMKVAFGDGSMADMFVQQYRDTLRSRAYLDKVSKEIGVDPHKLLDMKGQAILDKLKNKLAPKTDEVSLAMMEDIAAGRVNAKTIEDIMAPFKGKDAMPLTDADFLATVTIYADKAIQDYLIEKYNIKKLDTWTRVSSMKKALLSPLLIGIPYTTWLNNLWSNLGAQFFLLGELPMHGNSAINELTKSLGMEALPFAPKDRFGLASEVVDSTSKISLLLNPNDTIGKVTRTLRNFGGLFKTYSKIETYNTGSLFFAQVLNMHRRIKLPDMSENIRVRLTAEGVDAKTLKFMQDLANRAKSAQAIDELFVAGLEYDVIDVGAIEAAADVLSQGNPDRANIYAQVLHRLGGDEELLTALRTVTDPKDIGKVRDVLDSAIEKQVYVMLDESIRARKFEVENIMTKEGMAGGVSLMADAIFGELSHRITNSVSWGKAMEAADRAMAVGDYALKNKIIRSQRARSAESYKRFFAMQDMQFKTMADILQAGDANSKAFLEILTKRHGDASEIMAALEQNYQDYFDASSNGLKVKWEETEAKNEALMARLDKAETDNLKALARLWTTMLGSKITSNVSAAGLSSTDLQKGGTKLMKSLIDGYTELNKLRTKHYAEVGKLGGDQKRAAQMTFWNEVYQPTLGRVQSNFVDGNWQEFFKVKTEFAKTTYPDVAEPEAPPTPKTKVSAGEQAAENVKNKITRRAIEERAKANVDAVHAAAAATHAQNLWYKHLDAITNLTPAQRTWADIWVHVLDDVNTAKSGKPSGSWLAEIGTEAAQNADPNIPLGAVIDGKLREVASVTRWNDVANKLKTLLSKNKTEATFLKDVDNIIAELSLPADVDKALVARSLVDNIMTKEVQSKFTDFKLSDAVKGAFERLQFENDAVELKARNADRMKAAPTGKTVTLTNEITDDFAVESKRIQESAGQTLFTNLADYNKGVEDLVAMDKHATKAEIDEARAAYQGILNLKTESDVAKYNEEVIAKFVEAPVQDLVRQLLKEGKKPYSSNAYNAGAKGVWWTDADGKEGFTPLTVATGTAIKIDATAKLVDINTLIGAYTYDPDTRTINSNQLFDKPADKAPTKKQLRANAKALDPDTLLADVKGTELNAIFVDENGQVVSDGGNLLTLLYVKNNYPDIWAKYREALKANAATWGLSPKDIDALENGVLVLQVKGDADVTARISGEDTVAEPIEAKVSKLSDRLDDAEDVLQPSLFGDEAGLSKADNTLRIIAEDALELRKAGASPEIDSLLTRTDQLMTAIEAKPAAEVPPTLPITEYPVGSSPVHQNTGAAINELYELNIPMMRDTVADILTKRMQASERQNYKIKIPEGAQGAMKDYLTVTKENQRIRMATILDAAKRVTKDVMIDYSRRRGFDQALEMFFPYQFWYTRSMMMWLKRMVAKPAIAAAAFRYRELQRRNEMKGFPSRMGGKTPVYTPWLSEGMGDYMSVDIYGKFMTPMQLFQPISNYANLDAEVTTEAQRYIYELVKQKIVSDDDARVAITTMSGTIWEDALQYVKMNSMADKTDPFTLASMAINPDPMINIMYQGLRGTPEKISPLPLTRIGNSFEAIGGDTVLGIIGTILSFPEDAIRKAADIPQAGEYGDYYVDFWLANMATYDKYPVDVIMNAMISREGEAYDEAYALAQQYIGLRTPGTPFFQAIKDGHRDPNTLAAAFLMSFMPTGTFPDGEMEMRGLKNKYQEAWEDYERGDKEALEKFYDTYPEYKVRQAMFQEPTQRLRGHLINIIWDKYTQLPTANRAIAADTLGDSFKAYFLDDKTKNYNAVDEGTLTTWAKQLGGMVPSTPETEQEAEQTVAPMKLYPEDRAQVIQAFSDERKAKFPDYWLYQGVYYNLPKDKQKKFLTQVPSLQRYWDWKDAQGEANPILKSYFDDLSNNSKSGSYDTEYDAEAAADYMAAFDENLLKEVLSSQASGDPLSSGAKAELNTLFQLAGKPGGDFNLWLKVLLNE